MQDAFFTSDPNTSVGKAAGVGSRSVSKAPGGWWRKTESGAEWVVGIPPNSIPPNSWVLDAREDPADRVADHFWKDVAIWATMTWSGWSTGQFLGSMLEGGIPALVEGGDPIWGGLGLTQEAAITEIAVGAMGYLQSADYIDEDWQESTWWGSFGSAALFRGLDVWDAAPDFGDRVIDAAVDVGKSILDYPVVGSKGSGAMIEVGLSDNFWGSDWEWFMDIYN